MLELRRRLLHGDYRRRLDRRPYWHEIVRAASLRVRTAHLDHVEVLQVMAEVQPSTEADLCGRSHRGSDCWQSLPGGRLLVPLTFAINLTPTAWVL
jgi:hypothetical protein